jgi:hypothetical protein
MIAVARILFPDGEFMLPAGSGYDSELLIEHLRWYVRRHGEVWLEVADDAWFVEADNEPEPQACSACHERRPDLVFRGETTAALCPRCSRTELCSSLRRWPLRHRHRQAATRPLGDAVSRRRFAHVHRGP